MTTQLHNLPASVLLAIAAGYAGYFVAYVGVRDHHKTVDVTFGTLVFGFFATTAFEASEKWLGWGTIVSSFVGFCTAVLLGAFWSRWFRQWTMSCLRFSKVTHADDLPSAWMALFRQTNLNTLQLSVKLKDGTWLKTDDLSKFQRAPNGPCTFGGAGDLLMYVTHQKSPEDEDFEEVDGVQDPKWGDEITFIPRDQIARIDVRRKS
jgi:hypothetical protein